MGCGRVWVVVAWLAVGCATGEDASALRSRPPDAGTAAPGMVPLGAVDLAFGQGGVAVLPVAGVEPRAMAVQPDGKIVVAGSFFDDPRSNFEGYVFRFLPDGTLDRGYDGDGVVLLDPHGLGAWTLALAPDGTLVLGGATEAGQLWRLHPDGSLADELTLGMDSAFIDTVAVAADGAIRAKGEAPVEGLYVTRVLPDGTIDPAYHGGAVPVGDFIEHDTVAMPDGSWIVLGNVDHDPDRRTSNLLRIGPDGTLDRGLGFVDLQADFVDTAATQGGRVLLGAGRLDRSIWVEARRLDGRLDETFGVAGKTSLGKARGLFRILPHGDGTLEVLSGDDRHVTVHHLRADGAVAGEPWVSALPAGTWLSHLVATLDPTTGDLLVAAIQHDKVGDLYLVTGTALWRIPRGLPRR